MYSVVALFVSCLKLMYCYVRHLIEHRSITLQAPMFRYYRSIHTERLPAE